MLVLIRRKHLYGVETGKKSYLEAEEGLINDYVVCFWSFIVVSVDYWYHNKLVGSPTIIIEIFKGFSLGVFVQVFFLNKYLWWMTALCTFKTVFYQLVCPVKYFVLVDFLRQPFTTSDVIIIDFPLLLGPSTWNF